MRVSSTQDSLVTFISKQLKSQTSTKLKSIEDPKFQKVVPITANVIHACVQFLWEISSQMDDFFVDETRFWRIKL